MADLFVFGTLCHAPLLARVTGRPEAALQTRRARLDGYAVRAVAGEEFPMLVAASGASAEGRLVEGLSAEETARVDFYEGAFAYALRDVPVVADGQAHAARAYFTDAPRWQADGAWDFDGWVARWGEIATLAAEEEMRHFGRPETEDLPRFAFRARAWARILGRAGAPQTVRSAMTRADITRFEPQDGFDGFFRLARFDLQYRRFDGGLSDPVRREAFVAFDAAMVLPYDPDRDLVLLTEQIRFGPLHRDDPAPWVLEPVAGLVDAGEDPAETARREAVEEARLEISSMQRMAGVYPSSGYSSEYFHMYLGLCDLGDRGGEIAGLDEENEDIRTHVLGFDRAMELVETGEINVGVTVLMLLWLARYRARVHGRA